MSFAISMLVEMQPALMQVHEGIEYAYENEYE